jgi:mannose-1-phosphate guanylyltransferase
VRAFILAAGFGTRLKPITNNIPKALVPVCGKPLLERALNMCRKSGIDAIGVNAHHLHGQLSSFQELSSIPFTLFHEDGIIRGTGGGLYFARDFLAQDDLFFVCNVDILCRFDLDSIIRDFKAGVRVASLLAAPARGRGTILYKTTTGDYAGTPLDGPIPRDVTAADFIGAALYRREFLDLLQPDDFSVVPVWKRIRDRGYPVGVTVLENSYWRDVGTFASLAAAHFESLAGVVDLDIPDFLRIDPASKRCFHKDLSPAAEPRISSGSWVELRELPGTVRIDKSIVYAGSSLPPEGVIENRICTPFGEVSIGK